MAPTGQGGQWQDVLCCSVCGQHFDESFLPVSLICGHVICRTCVKLPKTQEKPCPSDDWKPVTSLQEYPTNVALLSIVIPNKDCMEYSNAGTECETAVDRAMIDIASYFQKAESERGGSVFSDKLSKTLQRKVVSLICYQWKEADGRVKILKGCRAICERIMTEILLSIQSYTHVSSQLWSAVRARGCQFLGPAMQEDVLRLILMTLENGEDIARKNLVMYVVKTLEPDYPQVSKTCVGHVVQLLYRASCFNVIKREGESSLMQLKEEYRTYESLRREHDSQIVQIAFEAGLRIGPEQWSALLYADQGHKSHMQSIIDKLQSPNSYTQCLEELAAASENRRPDSKQVMSEMLDILRMFEKVTTEPVTMEQTSYYVAKLVRLLKLHTVTEGKQLGIFYSSVNKEQDKKRHYGTHRFKTRMCINIERTGYCDKGEQCTYAHSNKELWENSQNGASRKGEASDTSSRNAQGLRGYPKGRPDPRAPPFVPAAQRKITNGPNSMQPQFYRNIPPPRMVVPPHPPGAVIVGYPEISAASASSNGTAATAPPPPPPQTVMIMQSPTHIPNGPVMVMATQPTASANPPAVWAAQSPTGPPTNIIFPGASPSAQNPHTIWIQSTQSSVFPMESYDYGMIWGASSHFRESGADAEQLLAKRNEILHRLQPPMSQDDDDYEDGGIGHVSYTVASSVLDDSRIEVYPIAMHPPIELPAIPVSYSQTEPVMGEISQNRSRASSLTQPNPIITQPGPPSVVGGVIPATIAADCGTVNVLEPIVTSCIQPPPNCEPMSMGAVITAIPAAPTVCTEGFVANVAPPPQAAGAPPLIVDGATGLLAPIMRPILVTPTYPQELVSNSLDKIVDVKERLSEAQGNASEAENAHLRMELRMAECEMAHLDPFTKNNCLLRALQQVDRELQQLQIEPSRAQ